MRIFLRTCCQSISVYNCLQRFYCNVWYNSTTALSVRKQNTVPCKKANEKSDIWYPGWGFRRLTFSKCCLELCDGLDHHLRNVLFIFPYFQAVYNNTANFLHDNWLLDETHWSEEHKSYLDYGLHTDSVILAKPPFNPDNPHGGNKEKVRKVLSQPNLQYVNQVGYISECSTRIITGTLIAISGYHHIWRPLRG